MLEIEAKIKIDSGDSTADIEKRLKSAGAVFLGTQKQNDSYYNAPHRDFAVTDEALRIRVTEDKTELTYKGAKIRDGSGKTDAKAREEFNIGIESAQTMESILLKLGFTKSSAVFKTRKEYSFAGTTVALDEVTGLGSFVEIEVIGEDKDSALRIIADVKNRLEIKGEHITLSYLEMILKKEGLLN